MRTIVSMSSLLGVEDDEQAAVDIEACRHFPDGFRAFLAHWRFINRETGEAARFDDDHLWFGQAELRDEMVAHRWLLALKAGKLGFTELECAWDGYVALFGPRNARVHLFSKEFEAAKDLLEYVKRGLLALPRAFGVRPMGGERGGDTVRTFCFRVVRPDRWADPHDTRMVECYATGKNPSIDQSAQHAHVDELAHMEDAAHVWSAIQTTVAPGGSCHIVTRGAGEDPFLEELWAAASSGASRLMGFFAPWNRRPDRDDAWYEKEASSQPSLAHLAHYAAADPSDAFMGDAEQQFVPIELWDLCHEPDLPALRPAAEGDRTPIVIGLDAAVSNDCAAAIAVSRHPQRHDDPAIRACRLWHPPVDLNDMEAWVRAACAQYVVTQVAYDPYQLESMMQRLTRERVAWCEAFEQGRLRLEADNQLRSLIVQRRLAHNGDPDLRQHVLNARAKVPRDEDTKLRIVKRAPHRKVDLLVAASMAVYRCLYLRL